MQTLDKIEELQAEKQAEPKKKRRPKQAACHWPTNIIEAYTRHKGPYTVENISIVLQEESVELLNGWLVWQAVTDIEERTIAANIQLVLEIAAREAEFGQMLPDQAECLLEDGSVVKPDITLISWDKLKNGIVEQGVDNRKLIKGGPELVVEQRSPSNTRREDRLKRELYFANNVEVVWDVDIRRKRIWVYEAANPDKPTLFKVDGEISCEELLPNWKHKVADFFSPNLSFRDAGGQILINIQNESKAEGKQEGQTDALRQTLPLIVRLKFGRPLETEKIQNLDMAQLTSLIAAIETSPTFEDWAKLLD